MAEVSVVTLDVVEQILVRLDVEDLIRCKSVCKSWYYLISSPLFVKAQLKRSYENDRDNPELGHRRIALPLIKSADVDLLCNYTHMVGSCNGLVCVSPKDAEFVVVNPSTRVLNKLQTPSYRPHMRKIVNFRQLVCWGFGYDPSVDDYKVIAGFRKTLSKKRTLFYVLTLKSNIWQVIGEVKYRCIYGVDGILCGGKLHWFMEDAKKKVIISLDLSTHEFKQVPQPTDEEYECLVYDEHLLGVIEDCLCIYWRPTPLASKKWVLRNNKWELYNNVCCESRYDVAHCLLDPREATSYMYAVDDGKRVSCVEDYIRASIFVKSLVSPHPHSDFNSNNYYERQKRNDMQGQEANESVESDVKDNIRKRKRNTRRKGSRTT